jgi:hypothetical protein
MVCRAYSPDGDGGTVLVGLPFGSAGPSDWTKQTLAEAQVQFQSVMGRAPSDKEVY